MKGNFVTKDSNMSKYSERARELLQQLEKLGGQWKIVQIPREENEADSLAKSAAENGTAFHNTKFKEVMITPTIERNEVLVTNQTEDWTKPIVEYLDSDVLPEDTKEARKIRMKAAQYSLQDGTLYRRSFSHPWSKCVSVEEGDYVLREMYEGICGAHEA